MQVIEYRKGSVILVRAPVNGGQEAMRKYKESWDKMVPGLPMAFLQDEFEPIILQPDFDPDPPVNLNSLSDVQDERKA